MSNEDFEIVDFQNYDIQKSKSLITPGYNNNNNYLFIQNNNNNIYDKIEINDMTTEFEISFSLNDVINDISNSFRDLKDIQDQFRMDILRSLMTFNGEIIKNPQTIIDYLEYKYRETNPQLEKEYLMLCTQALFAIPFYIIQKNINNNELYLSEIVHKDIRNKRLSKKYKVDIVDGIITLEKYLRLFELNEKSDAITKYIVKINIEIDLIKEKYLLLNFQFI
jgi:hypothetical protein